MGKLSTEYFCLLISTRLGPLLCLHQSPAHPKLPLISLEWGLHSAPQLLPCSGSLCPSSSSAGKQTQPPPGAVSSSRILPLFMCLFAWLWLLLSPIAHIPRAKEKYSSAFQKHSALARSCFQWEQGLARAQRIPSQSLLENKGQRALVLLLRDGSLAFQAQLLCLVLLLPCSSNRSFLFVSSGSTAVLYWWAGSTGLLSGGLPLSS